MERLAARRLCIFNANFLFLLRRSKVSCNFILKISKKFSAFKFSPKLWDKPARNSLQFFTIPLGYLLGGALVDTVFEPFMAVQTPESFFCCLFGTGKGSGARFCFLSSASSASPFFSASAAASLSAGWKRTTKIKKLNQTTNTEYFKYDS